MEDIDQEPASNEIVEATLVPSKPRVWTVFMAILLAIVANFVLSVVVIIALIATDIGEGANAQTAARSLPAKIATPEAMIVLLVASGVAFGLAALVPAWLSPVRLRERLGLLPIQLPRRVYWLAIIASIVPLAVALGLALALAQIVPPDPSLLLLFENLTPTNALPFVLSIAIIPGFFEELLFRGYVQRRLLQRWSPFLAIGVTSLIFALVHVQPHHVVAAFPLGLWFGYVAWRSGSVWPSILCHAFVNGGINAWRCVIKFAHLTDTVALVVNALCVVVGLACLVFLLRMIARDDPNDELEAGSIGP